MRGWKCGELGCSDVGVWNQVIYCFKLAIYHWKEVLPFKHIIQVTTGDINDTRAYLKPFSPLGPQSETCPYHICIVWYTGEGLCCRSFKPHSLKASPFGCDQRRFGHRCPMVSGEPLPPCQLAYLHQQAEWVTSMWPVTLGYMDSKHQTSVFIQIYSPFNMA